MVVPLHDTVAISDRDNAMTMIADASISKAMGDEEQYAICWIVDFPMYEIGEESGELEFCHNPFSMPQGGQKALEEAEGNMEKLLAIKADQ